MRVLAIRHVKIEHLGLIENYLKEKNFEIDYVRVFQNFCKFVFPCHPEDEVRRISFLIF